METVVWLVAAVGVVVAVDRLALWAEGRGWIHWRRTRPEGASGVGLLELDALVNPGARHVIEVREAEPAEERTADDIVKPSVPGILVENPRREP